MKSKEEKQRCVNCNEEHSANYKKCKSFIDYTQKYENKRSTNNKTVNDFSSKFVNSQVSYRNALISNNNFTEDVPPLNNNFMFFNNEINDLFNTNLENLMLKIKNFMPI